jgi:hypothetical protein
MLVLQQFIRLDSAQQFLVMCAVTTLSLAALALRLVPFSMVRSTAGRPPVTAYGRPRFSAENVAWAIAAVGGRCGATCLTQAVAAQWLMARLGLAGVLHIGVSHGKPFAAHAWLESNGRVILGGESTLENRAMLL